MKIGICYCQKNNKDTWKLFAKNLERLLKCKIELVFFENEKSQFKILQKEIFDLIYISFPVYIYELYRKKNFLPFARLKNEPKNPFILVSYKPTETLKKDNAIKVGVIDHPTSAGLFIPVKLYTDLSLVKIWLIRFTYYEEIIKALENKEIDAGVLPARLLHEKGLQFPFSRPFVIQNTHYFMLPREGKNTEKILNALQSLEEIEIVSFWERHNILSYCFFSQHLPSLLESYINNKKIFAAPHFGILIYREHYIYANSYIRKLLGYSLKEIRKLKPEEIIFYEKDKKMIKNISQKRIKGKFLEKSYKELVLKKKNGQKCYVLAYSTTILFKGKYAGVVVLVDFTEENKLKRLYRVLKEVNQLLISCTSEKEIYHFILPLLARELELKGAWIGKVDEEKRIIKFEIGYPEKVKAVLEAVGLLNKEGFLNLDSTKFNGIANAVKNKEIFIVPEVQSFPYPEKVKEYAKAFNIYSICVLPIVKDGKVVSIISMGIDEPGFFTEKFKDLLTELQKDIAFALKKIELLHNEYIISKFVEKISELMIIAAPDGKIEYLNPYGKKLLQIKEATNIFEIFPELEKIFQEVEKNEEKEKYHVLLLKKKEKKIPLEVKILSLSLPGGIKKILLCGRDLYKDLMFEEERKKLKEYDLLTGILNYYGFTEQLKDLVDLLKRKGILILIDIDKFGMINHFYGIEAGEECLKTIAERLKNFVKNKGIIGRVAGNTFAIFLIDVEKDKIFSYLNELKSIITKPFFYKGKAIRIEFHGSVLYYPDDAKNSKELYEKASLLLKHVKEKNLRDIEIYNPFIEKNIQKVFYAEELIKTALENKQFIFYYQPYFDSNSLEVAGFEALIRIKKDNEIIPPSEFIEFLENSAYLKEVEAYIIYKNVETLKKWNVPISINLSFTGIESLYILKIFKNLENIFKDLPNYFILEITERRLAQDIEKAKRVLSVLKAYNSKIALDDFGTGYSSLNYLKDLPIDIVKIDKSFVKLMLKDNRTYSIVESLINLAKKLGVKTVAEGVETEEEMEALKNLGCDFLQGFYFSPPLPPEEAEKLLSKKKA